MSAVERKWEYHPDQGGNPHLREMAEAIVAAETLRLPYVSLVAARADHFMNGGNVVKGRCVKFTLRCSDKLPSTSDVGGEAP